MDAITCHASPSGSYIGKSLRSFTSPHPPSYGQRFGQLDASSMQFFFMLAGSVWTVDHLHTRGWLNRSLCQLCKWEPETVASILLGWRFSIYIWDIVCSWLGFEESNFKTWSAFALVKDWWTSVTNLHVVHRKYTTSLPMLVCRKFQSERKAIDFRNKSFVPTTISAKHLGLYLFGPDGVFCTRRLA